LGILKADYVNGGEIKIIAKSAATDLQIYFSYENNKKKE